MIWDRRFLRLAELVAGWSKDPSTKVGAVIVNADRQVLGLGYNGFPRGVHDLEERYFDRPTKYAMIVHAEANAILNARQLVRGCTLYALKYPCSSCAKLIIQAGIARVVSPRRDPADAMDQRWEADARVSETMLREAAVVCDEVERA